MMRGRVTLAGNTRGLALLAALGVALAVTLGAATFTTLGLLQLVAMAMAPAPKISPSAMRRKFELLVMARRVCRASLKRQMVPRSYF
jgi:hypothetical protein